MFSVNVNSSIYNHCITLQHVSLHIIMWATVFKIETSSCINVRGSFSNRKYHLSVNLKIKEKKLTLESEAYISYSQYFSKPRVMLHVLSGWHNATPCLVLSHLAFFWYGPKNPPPYMLTTVSNTDCNRFAKCSWGISYISKVWNRHSYPLKKCMLNITKNPD